jgi:hypothetical protein
MSYSAEAMMKGDISYLAERMEKEDICPAEGMGKENMSYSAGVMEKVDSYSAVNTSLTLQSFLTNWMPCPG